jgi:hypothetical protein
MRLYPEFYQVHGVVRAWKLVASSPRPICSNRKKPVRVIHRAIDKVGIVAIIFQTFEPVCARAVTIRSDRDGFISINTSIR